MSIPPGEPSPASLDTQGQTGRAWMNAMAALLLLALVVAVVTFVHFSGQLQQDVHPSGSAPVPVLGGASPAEPGVALPAMHHRVVVEAKPSPVKTATAPPPVPADHSPVPLKPLPPGATDTL